MTYFVRYFPVLMLFVATLLVACVVVKRSSTVSCAIERLGAYASRNAFLYMGEQEIYKFAVLRKALGVIVFLRAAAMIDLLPLWEINSLVGMFAFIELTAGLLLMLGLLTQYALASLVVVSWQIGEAFLRSSTLGNDIAAILAVLLLFTQAGRVLSLDALVLKAAPRRHTLLGYSLSTPSVAANGLAKLLALFSYWLVCVYSLAIHLNEPAWTTGVAGPLLLTNNFMAPWSEWFVALFEDSTTAVFASRMALWAMMLWYAAVLPFVLLGGWWRRYVVLWGLLFFAFSLVLLDLGWLAEIEFVLWAALFWAKTGVDRTSPLLVFFDDRCNLCDRTVQAVSFLDVFGVVRLMPASIHVDDLTKHGITFEQAMEDLYGVETASGKKAFGYEFYLLLARRVVLLWPVLPVLLIGKWMRVGPAVYRFVAERRRAMFGVCVLGRPKAQRYASAPGIETLPLVNKGVALHILFLGLVYLVSVPMPYLGVDGKVNKVTRAAHIYGIAPINVFNQTDLRMAETWFLLKHSDSGVTLPVLDEHGKRLEYHASDRVYFGHTVAFRRQEIDRPDCGFARHETRLRYLAEVWLDEEDMAGGRHTFDFVQYRQPLPDREKLLQNIYQRQPTDVLCGVDFEVTR